MGTFDVPIARSTKYNPALSWNYFHPGRCDVRFAPEWFRCDLKAIDARLDCVWHPLHERWFVWAKNPRVTYHLCAGWQPLFPVQYPDGSYAPLDQRTLAEAWARSPRAVGRGHEYFKRVEAEITRDKEAYVKQRHQDKADQAGEWYDYRQIKNIGSGSKFAESHS